MPCHPPVGRRGTAQRGDALAGQEQWDGSNPPCRIGTDTLTSHLGGRRARRPGPLGSPQSPAAPVHAGGKDVLLTYSETSSCAQEVSTEALCTVHVILGPSATTAPAAAHLVGAVWEEGRPLRVPLLLPGYVITIERYPCKCFTAVQPRSPCLLLCSCQAAAHASAQPIRPLPLTAPSPHSYSTARRPCSMRSAPPRCAMGRHTTRDPTKPGSPRACRGAP